METNRQAYHGWVSPIKATANLIESILASASLAEQSSPITYPTLDKETILRQWVETSRNAPTERVTLFVQPMGAGRYHVESIDLTTEKTPPCLYQFLTDNLDEIVIWSTNPSLSEATAHEIAIQIGEEIGWYV